MMEFYTSIADHYDYIFPLNKQQLNWVKQETGTTSLHLLDAGCATGSLAIELAKSGFKVDAFDLDTQMIELARRKDDNKVVRFTSGDLLKMEENYAANTFDGLLCFGNTLVHLNDENEIAQFLNAAYLLLKQGGKLMIQVLHYENILRRKLEQLPLIDNEVLRFERSYRYPENNSILFDTRLTIKANGKTLDNSVKLYPVSHTQIRRLITDAGFCSVKSYGDFAGNELTEQSIPLLITAVKNLEQST
ncbi:class I SAM-dependent methyltransferase [Roseimarinus sediminis]|uniref:class I SAM-dependent methyltransferase n=1 Tax=Roseimarinus sediminis TaxID=1610899 RepID=UPI003D1DCE79